MVEFVLNIFVFLKAGALTLPLQGSGERWAGTDSLSAFYTRCKMHLQVYTAVYCACTCRAMKVQPPCRGWWPRNKKLPSSEIEEHWKTTHLVHCRLDSVNKTQNCLKANS